MPELATVIPHRRTAKKEPKGAEEPKAPLSLSQDDVHSLEELDQLRRDQLSQTVLALLTQTINDFLNPDYPEDAGIELVDVTPDDVPRCNGCDPDLCPVEWVHDGYEPFLGMRKSCQRFRFLEKLPEFSPREWLLSKSEEPWSFNWCCSTMNADPDVIRNNVMRLPKSRRGITMSGRKLYKSNSKTYSGSEKKRITE